MTSMSKLLFALMSAFTTCMLDDGSTFVSSSPQTSSSFPCSLPAFTMFELASYSGPTGQPIHSSFHHTLSIRLSWQPANDTAAL